MGNDSIAFQNFLIKMKLVDLEIENLGLHPEQ